MSRVRDRHGLDRSTARDLERTRKVAQGALRRAGPAGAVRLLREGACESLEGAVAALRAGAGVERAQQLIDAAQRRLRAIAVVEDEG